LLALYANAGNIPRCQLGRTISLPIMHRREAGLGGADFEFDLG
jgi:hypothetical protein